MADFNFITSGELRQVLENDYREVKACLDAQAWKAVHVLAGSIVEAVLMDALSGEAGFDAAEVERMELSRLTNLAKARELLSEETVDLSTVIRRYRNLIHPGRVTRLEKIVDQSSAVVAAELIEIITREVSAHKKRTYGYTAEQVLERLRGGESALPLIPLVVGETREYEIERLLTDLLPEAYRSALLDTESTSAEDRHLVVCYRKVFEAATEAVKLSVMRNLYSVYRNAPESIVLLYEDNFVRGSYLQYLADNEQRFIKAHLLPRVTLESLGNLLWNLVGIGRFLTPSEAGNLATTLILAMQGEDGSLARRARTRLFNEYPHMTAESRAAVRISAELLSDPILCTKLADREQRIKAAAATEGASS